MSSAAVRAPVATAFPPRRRRLLSIYRAWRTRRALYGVFVAILDAADLPPGA